MDQLEHRLRESIIEQSSHAISNSDVRTYFLRHSRELIADPLFYVSSGLGIFDVLLAHYLIIDFFRSRGEGIGGFGPKSTAALSSTLARQFVSSGRQPKWLEPIDVCASLMYGLIQNHPFHDANKRTAFLSTLYYLWEIDRVITIGDVEFEDFTVEIANRNLAKFAEIYSLDPKCEDFEVRAISEFLHRNSRSIDHTNYTITYNDLDRILKHFGFQLGKPNGNFINVTKHTNGKDKFICQVGFPAWQREVGKSAIKSIRNACGLLPQDGVDSQVFFKQADQILSIVAKYEEPLRRLAFR